MIFLAVGTQKFQLNRLLKLMDHLVEQNQLKEPLFAQIGYSTYEPKNYQFTRFLDKKDYLQKIEEASLLVTHGGVGTIIESLKADKRVIVFPRLKKYNEHVDNHQLDIGYLYSKSGYVLCYSEGDSMIELIDKARKHSFTAYSPRNKVMLETIKGFMDTNVLIKREK